MSKSWVYVSSEPGLWTTGFYRPDGGWESDSDFDSKECAASRVSFLNGSAEDYVALIDSATRPADGLTLSQCIAYFGEQPYSQAGQAALDFLERLAALANRSTP